MEYTEEQQKDFAERAQAFQEEHAAFYQTLKGKYQCQFVQSVQTVPGPQGIFGLTVAESVGDLKYMATPSPKEFMTSDEVPETD
jgi:hypothetical protein